MIHNQRNFVMIEYRLVVHLLHLIDRYRRCDIISKNQIQICPLAALALLYFVAAKYARYDPADESPRWPLAARLGAAGFLIPPLLPLSLCLVVSYLLRAERNLSRYLYDYD